MTLNSYIDHTLLNAKIELPNITLHCEQAMKYDFYCVCVNSVHIPYVRSLLDRTSVKICATVNFPLGASSLQAVCCEAKQAIEDGADEIDTVINITLLKSGYSEQLLEELHALRRITEGKVLKIIFENCLLTNEEKILACGLCCEAKVDFVKTSTGFSDGGAILEDVRLMKQHTQDHPVQVKAAGGIRDYQTVMQFIEAGASRIGTSNGVAIITDDTTGASHSY